MRSRIGLFLTILCLYASSSGGQESGTAVGFSCVQVDSGKKGTLGRVLRRTLPSGGQTVRQADIRVSKVDPNGIAARAGIRVGDRLLAVNGMPVFRIDDLKLKLASLDPSAPNFVTVERDGKTMNFDLAPPRSPVELSSERTQENVGKYHREAFKDLFHLQTEILESLRVHDDQKPKRPQIEVTTFPRYNELQAAFNSARDKHLAAFSAALARHRVFALMQAPGVFQRLTPTTVMAGDFNGFVQNLGFCDDGLCRYQGNILVHLEKPDVSSHLALGMLLCYEGLKSYTTVQGAPETVPDFREVRLEEFPDVPGAFQEVFRFQPNDDDIETYLRPKWIAYYQNQWPAWASEGLTLEMNHLEERLKVVQRLVKERSGVHAMPVTLAGGTLVEEEVPEETLNALPGILESTERATRDLLGGLRAMRERIRRDEPLPEALQDPVSMYRHTMLADTSEEPEGLRNTLLMYRYVERWIHLNARLCFSDVRAYTDPGLWIGPEDEPWGDLQCWAGRFEVPRATGEGGLIQPSWWRDNPADNK